MRAALPKTAWRDDIDIPDLSWYLKPERFPGALFSECTAGDGIFSPACSGAVDVTGDRSVWKSGAFLQRFGLDSMHSVTVASHPTCPPVVLTAASHCPRLLQALWAAQCCFIPFLAKMRSQPLQTVSSHGLQCLKLMPQKCVKGVLWINAALGSSVTGGYWGRPGGPVLPVLPFHWHSSTNPAQQWEYRCTSHVHGKGTRAGLRLKCGSWS